jgi:hypothetical protein
MGKRKPRSDGELVQGTFDIFIIKMLARICRRAQKCTLSAFYRYEYAIVQALSATGKPFQRTTGNRQLAVLPPVALDRRSRAEC